MFHVETHFVPSFMFPLQATVHNNDIVCVSILIPSLEKASPSKIDCRSGAQNRQSRRC